jgi:hypothetical protein
MSAHLRPLRSERIESLMWECQLGLAPPRSSDLAPLVGCVVTEGGHFRVPVLVVRRR